MASRPGGGHSGWTRATRCDAWRQHRWPSGRWGVDAGPLRATLEGMNVPLVDEPEGRLIVVAADGYRRPELAELNARARATDVPGCSFAPSAGRSGRVRSSVPG